VYNEILASRTKVRSDASRISDSVNQALSFVRDSSSSLSEMRKSVDKALALEKELGVVNSGTDKYVAELKSLDAYLSSAVSSLSKVGSIK